VMPAALAPSRRRQPPWIPAVMRTSKPCSRGFSQHRDLHRRRAAGQGARDLRPPRARRRLRQLRRLDRAAPGRAQRRVRGPVRHRQAERPGIERRRRSRTEREAGGGSGRARLNAVAVRPRADGVPQPPCRTTSTPAARPVPGQPERAQRRVRGPVRHRQAERPGIERRRRSRTARHGLDVDFVNFGGSTEQLLEAIATGKADAGIGPEVDEVDVEPVAGEDPALLGQRRGGGADRGGVPGQPERAWRCAG
jgi:hypothetical protein